MTLACMPLYWLALLTLLLLSGASPLAKCACSICTPPQPCHLTANLVLLHSSVLQMLLIWLTHRLPTC